MDAIGPEKKRRLRVGTDPAAYGKAIDEQVLLWNAGVDGLFTDQPDIGVPARDMAFAGRAAAGA